jgi:hypothetical protein
MSNLLRMVYVSTSTNPINTLEGHVHRDIGRILMQSRKNNPKKQVGGVLYFSNNYFFQCLEGEQEEVNKVYQKISADPRHSNIQSLSVKRIEQRQFSNWSMKYVALRDNVNHLLKSKGRTEFNPYDFNEEMITEVLSLFTTEDDTTSGPDQNYKSTTKSENSKKTGFFSKLFNKF